MKNRIFSLLVTLCMVVSLFAISPVTASAATNSAEAMYGDYLWYTVNEENTTVTISHCNISATEIVIPSEINGIPVKKIGSEAFRDCNSLTSITIPDSVTYIGVCAFYGCGSLTNITIPNGVTSIRFYAFYGCSSLESIAIPDSVTSIGGSAFSGCHLLQDVYYSGSMEQWSASDIQGGNESLTDAVIHYNSTMPKDPHGTKKITKISGIDIGEYIQMGTYYGEPILWRCVDIDENGPLMLSDRIICLKPFDACGENTSGSHGRGFNSGYCRKLYGSSYWADSNIRCWLNSEADAGNVKWACGNPPDDGHVIWGNSYADEAGFLTNFTQNEKNIIKEVTQESLLDYQEYPDMSQYGSDYYYHSSSDYSFCSDNYNTAYSEQVKDKVFLLDLNQIYKVCMNDNLLGGKNYYLGIPTEQAVSNSEFKPNWLTAYSSYYWWLRSPFPLDKVSSGVHFVGGVKDSPHSGANGVRPAFYLDLSSSIFLYGFGTKNNPFKIIDKIEDVTVVLNDYALTFDQPPIIIDGRTLVPLRAIFEALGATVDWNSDTQTVTSNKGNTAIRITIGDNKLYVNDNVTVLDVSAQIVNDRTLVPIRAISEAFGCNVDWNDETKTVSIRAN